MKTKKTNPTNADPRTTVEVELTYGDVAKILDLLFNASTAIRSDQETLEEAEEEGDLSLTGTTLKVLYQAEHRLNALAAKLKSQCSVDFDFDVRTQAVIAVQREE
jgi:hypothetical protein|tara:strand:- start:80 stop:394 length:315 start_codon:yes stop_codon:yes gene_type:complete